MITRAVYTLILCTVALANYAQVKLNVKTSTNGLQYGFAVKAQVEFSTVKQTQGPHLRVAITGGIGSSS